MRAWHILREIAKYSATKLIAFWRFLFEKISAPFSKLSAKKRRRIFLFMNLGFVFAMALMARPTAMQALGRTLLLSEYKAVWTQSEVSVLDNNGFPGGRTIDWLLRELPSDSKFLIYRQAEFSYYVDQDWIYDFDPKIIDLYDLQTPEAIQRYLVERGITHIFVPNYMPATLYNSPVVNLIGDPNYTTELYSHSGMRVFEVFKTPKNWICEAQPGLKSWVQGIIGTQTTFEADGSGLFGPTFNEAAPRTFSEFQDKGSIFSGRIASPIGASVVSDDEILMVWPADYIDRVGILSGFGPLYLAPKEKVDRNKFDSIHIDFEISGNGFLEIWIYEYDENGAWASRRLWDAVQDSEKGDRRVKIQALLASTTTSYRVLVANGGTAGGDAEIKGLNACGVVYNVNANLEFTPDIETQPKNTALTSVQNWNLVPANEAGKDEDNGTVILMGRSCSEFAFFCRTLNVKGPSSRLLLRRYDDKGFQLQMPVDSGFFIFSQKPETSLRTLVQCRLSRNVWFLERSPAREGFVEKIYMKYARKLFPTGNSPTDRPARLEVNVSTDKNTVVSASLLWRNAKGKKSCYFLGEQVLENSDTDLAWDFPLPEKYSDLTLSVTTDHPLNEHINLDVAGARVLVTN